MDTGWSPVYMVTSYVWGQWVKVECVLQGFVLLGGRQKVAVVLLFLPAYSVTAQGVGTACLLKRSSDWNSVCSPRHMTQIYQMYCDMPTKDGVVV